MLFPVLGIISCSCVKQGSCEEGIIGTFQYLEETILVNNKKVTAVFTGDDGTLYHIMGSVPQKYKSGNLIKVRVIVEDTDEGRIITFEAKTVVYKLKCIERED